MADKDRAGDGPSLELPSFGFGRKKKAKPAEPPAPVVASAPPFEPEATPKPEPVVEPERLPEPDTKVQRVRPQREFSLRAIPALQAALVVGALVGLLAVLLTFASLKLCEVVSGTDSCGGPGLLLLAATLVILTYAGAWLLRGFGIDDPGSTSLLAVALLAVLTMLLFLDVIHEWWMLIAVPVVAMASYALSWWVSTRFVEPDA